MSPASPITKRDLRFDTLRGALLVSMTINHLPSSMRLLTDGSLGLFSSAEGFIFLSGLLAGMVYTKRLRRDGRARLKQATIRRANMIYGWHLGGFFAAMVMVNIGSRIFGFCSQTSPQLFYSHPLQAVILGATMLYQPGILDILPMYCAFVLALAYVLPALEAGKRWWVLGISALLWLSVQWAPPVDGAPLYPLHVGSFNLLAWQFLFVAGVVIGHARVEAPESVRMRLHPVAIVGSVAVCLYGLGICHWHWANPWDDRTFGITLNKPALGLLRLSNFAAAAYLIGLVAARFPRAFACRPLEFLGQHSLSVVAGQSLVAMLLLQFPRLFYTPVSNIVTSCLAIALLFLFAGLHHWGGQLFAPAERRAPRGQPGGELQPVAG